MESVKQTNNITREAADAYIAQCFAKMPSTTILVTSDKQEKEIIRASSYAYDDAEERHIFTYRNPEDLKRIHELRNNIIGMPVSVDGNVMTYKVRWINGWGVIKVKEDLT